MFIETQFPLDIAYGSQGGPQYSTRIVTSASGFEDRNANWSAGRHSYDAATGVKTYAQLERLIAFFHVVQGSAHGFRWPDDLDDRSCARSAYPAFGDQVIGTADGVETDFQLVKTYTFGASTRVRTISKPVSGTVVVGVNGIEQSSGWSVNTTTGLITFSVAPTTGSVTAGYRFDVPCRLNTDMLVNSIDAYRSGSASVPVIEIRV